MQTSAAVANATLTLTKANPTMPAFRLGDPSGLAVNGDLAAHYGADTVHFPDGQTILMPEDMVAGSDYEVILDLTLGVLLAQLFGAGRADSQLVIGGFHYAPAGNATARNGGVAGATINPYSIYDLNFRPACPDPRGMALVDGRFWADIYLLGVDHATEGTSRHAVTIADGRSLSRLNYADAVAIMAGHGKQLLGVTEFWAAAYGVKEKASRDDDPETTRIRTDDLAFVSKWGLQQATGCMWGWGHDEDPDEPRASLFGGSWLGGSDAGSRYARLVFWPGDSGGSVGARGRSDHLIHG